MSQPPHRTNSEVERFLLRLGLPQRVVDVFNREQCYDLSSFLYLQPQDLEDLDVGDALEGVDPALWEKATTAVLAGVDEVKVQTEHAWELSTLQDGKPFYFNPLTLETRWEKPPAPTRQPRFDIDWKAPVENIQDNEDYVSLTSTGTATRTTTYFDAVQHNPFAFEDKDWSEESVPSPLGLHLSVPEVYDDEDDVYRHENDPMQAYNTPNIVSGSNDDYLYDFGKVVSPKSSRATSPVSSYNDQDPEVINDPWDAQEEQWGAEEAPQEGATASEWVVPTWYVCIDPDTGATDGPFSMVDVMDWYVNDLVPKDTLMTDLNEWWTLEELVTWHQGLVGGREAAVEGEEEKKEEVEEVEEEEEEGFDSDDDDEENMADHFLCTPDGEVVGPYLRTDVDQWHGSGMLEPGTLVSRGDGEWLPLPGAAAVGVDDDDEEEEKQKRRDLLRRLEEQEAIVAAYVLEEEDAQERRRSSSVEEASRASAERFKLRSSSQERLFAPYYAASVSPTARWKSEKDKQLSREEREERAETDRQEDQFRAEQIEAAETILNELRQEAERGTGNGDNGDNGGDNNYYVLNHFNEVEGPYHKSALVSWYQLDQLSAETLVCSDSNSDEWVPLHILLGMEEGEDEADEADEADEDEWHLLSEENEILGPYHRDDLEAWYYGGQVDGSVMVHHPEMEVRGV